MAARRKKYFVIGETAKDVVEVVTTASTEEKRIAAFHKKYPDAEVLEIVEANTYK